MFYTGLGQTQKCGNFKSVDVNQTLNLTSKSPVVGVFSQKKCSFQFSTGGCLCSFQFSTGGCLLDYIYLWSGLSVA